MLASVANEGPAVNKSWLNVACLLDRPRHAYTYMEVTHITSDIIAGTSPGLHCVSARLRQVWHQQCEHSPQSAAVFCHTVHVTRIRTCIPACLPGLLVTFELYFFMHAHSTACHNTMGHLPKLCDNDACRAYVLPNHWESGDLFLCPGWK